MPKGPVGVSALFLDRDGVINEDVGHLSDPQSLVLIPGSARAIRTLNERGIPVIVVSNQSGVARGYYPESAVQSLHEMLAQRLAQEGATIDAFYYCPHHPTEGIEAYRIACDCRKPGDGMLRAAARNLNLNLTKCVMVGDKRSDIEAGAAAGCRTVLVLTGYGGKEPESSGQGPEPDHIAGDLQAAIAWLDINA